MNQTLRSHQSLRWTLITTLLTLLVACNSHPIVPEAKNVTVTRGDVAKDCHDLGRVQGLVSSVKATVEQAIEDMKLDAARKGANYVHMEATSALGMSTSGTAYFCP